MSSGVAVEIQGGRWKRYPAYRDSGVEWLGEVPEHWGASKIIRYAYLKTGGTPDRNNMAYWENGTINWISSGEVNKKKIFETNNKITSDGLANSNAMILPINSIMVALNGQGKTKGTVAILKIKSSCNQSLSAFICDEKKLHFNYLFYYLESKYKELRGLVGDSLRDGLSLGHLKSIDSPLPPIFEQRAIAAFLDRETGRIDILIEKKERQVELLQEKRAALISHTVTKGLDPDVTMKDSGVEWLREVPEHWEVTPLRGVLNQRGEYNIGPRTTNILSVVKDVGVINYDERVASGNKKSENVEQYKIIHKGDIVVNRMNVIIGSVGVANEFGAASIEYYVLYAKDSSVYTEYYGHIFSSKMFQKNLGRLGSGILGHRLRIPFEVLKSEMLPKPPYSEQHDIANALNDKRKRIDTLTTKIQESISKLREYRTALISAAVTGKIDVREDLVS